MTTGRHPVCTASSRRLPFNRVIAMLAFQGLQVAAGTLAGVARRLDGLLAPLAGAIAARNAASGHAHADETSWRVFGQPAEFAATAAVSGIPPAHPPHSQIPGNHATCDDAAA